MKHERIQTLETWPEYRAVKQFYGNRTAERSKVPLIHHIHEGIAVMEAKGSSHYAMAVFFQTGINYLDEWDYVGELRNGSFGKVDKAIFKTDPKRVAAAKVSQASINANFSAVYVVVIVILL